MRLRELRERMKITQVELANILSVGQPTIANWEAGRSYPRTNLLPALARALHCSISDLFAESE